MSSLFARIPPQNTDESPDTVLSACIRLDLTQAKEIQAQRAVSASGTPAPQPPQDSPFDTDRVHQGILVFDARLRGSG